METMSPCIAVVRTKREVLDKAFRTMLGMWVSVILIASNEFLVWPVGCPLGLDPPAGGVHTQTSVLYQILEPTYLLPFCGAVSSVSLMCLSV